MGNCLHLTDGNIKDDDFITRLHYQQTGITEFGPIQKQFDNDSKPLDQRRLVFVSLLGLYQTFDLCPASRLYSAICVLPIKKKWIYDAKLFKKESKSHLFLSSDGDLSIFKDKHRVNQFLELLQWKQSQNLLFSMLDQYEVDEKDKSHVAAFWIYFNRKLCALCDPVKQKKYKSLNLNAEYWRLAYESSIGSRFKTQGHKFILNELYFATQKFKFKAIQTIIYQSNPRTLNPIAAYSPYKMDCDLSKSKSFVTMKMKKKIPFDHGCVCFTNGCSPDIDDSDGDDDDEGIWMISTEYNEYDLD